MRVVSQGWVPARGAFVAWATGAEFGENRLDDGCVESEPATVMVDVRMKRTLQRSKIRLKRQHGFLARKSTKGGRETLQNRRHVGRKRLTPV